MLDPARAREVLAKFGLRAGDRMQRIVKDEGAAGCCALVDGEDVTHDTVSGYSAFARIHASTAVICSGLSLSPRRVRRQTASSPVRANSRLIIQRSSASVRVAPKSR